jgi:hypothetical protein
LALRWIKAKRKVLLSLLGLLLSTCGFVLASANRIPWADHIVYGKINALRDGFNKVCGLPIKIESDTERYRRLVQGDMKHYPHDKGFTELSSFILEDLKSPQSEYFAKTWDGQMSFEEFKRRAVQDGFSKMTYTGIPGNRSGMVTYFGNNRINVYLKNSSNERADYAAFFAHKVAEGIEKEYKRATFPWAMVFFLAGLVLSILQIDWRGSKKQAEFQDIC